MKGVGWYFLVVRFLNDFLVSKILRWVPENKFPGILSFACFVDEKRFYYLIPNVSVLLYGLNVNTILTLILSDIFSEEIDITNL